MWKAVIRSPVRVIAAFHILGAATCLLSRFVFIVELGRGWQEPLPGGNDKSVLQSLVILLHVKSPSGTAGGSVPLPRCARGGELSSSARSLAKLTRRKPYSISFPNDCAPWGRHVLALGPVLRNPGSPPQTLLALPLPRVPWRHRAGEHQHRCWVCAGLQPFVPPLPSICSSQLEKGDGE